MLASVYFDDEPRVEANEICNKAPERDLAAEAMVIDLLSTQS